MHCLSNLLYCHLWSVRFSVSICFILRIRRMLVRFINITFFVFSRQIVLKLLIRNRIQLDMNNTVHRSSCKAPMFLFRFKWELNFVDRFSKTKPLPNFTNICREGHKLYSFGGLTVRRKDTMKATVAFNHFEAELQNGLKIYRIPANFQNFLKAE